MRGARELSRDFRASRARISQSREEGRGNGRDVARHLTPRRHVEGFSSVREWGHLYAGAARVGAAALPIYLLAALATSHSRRMRGMVRAARTRDARPCGSRLLAFSETMCDLTLSAELAVPAFRDLLLF